MILVGAGFGFVRLERKVRREIDWALLLLFSGLFVVVRGAEQALTREFEVAGIDVEADQQAIRGNARGHRAGVTRSAEGAVDDHRVGRL